MKNSKLRRILLTLACAVLLVSLSVGATLAYLTSKTSEVKNTFTVGKVEITLDEAKVDEYGVVDTTATSRVTENTYKLIPGHSYTKDPTVHVSADSEVSWLFVKIVNEIAAIEDGYNPVDGNPNIYESMVDFGNWSVIDAANGIYAYGSPVNPGDNITVFSSFRIKGDANVADYEGKTITVQAYAVQMDGFSTPQAAWAAAPLTEWTTPANP